MFYDDPKTVYNKFKEEGILDFMYDMKDYYETNNYIFTHAFIPIDQINLKYKKNWRNSTKEEFESSRWINGIDMSMNYNIFEPNKKIVIGHYHTSYGHVLKSNPNIDRFKRLELEFSENANFEIFEDNNIIGVDACTHLSKKINILVVED